MSQQYSVVRLMIISGTFRTASLICLASNELRGPLNINYNT